MGKRGELEREFKMEKGGKESARRTRGSDFTGGGVKWPDGISSQQTQSARVCGVRFPP